MSSEKRARSANFTGEEKILLLNIIKKYSHIVECKKTDAVTWREKDDTWKRISNEFHANSPSVHRRTMDNLKKFYENQKKIIRKKAAEERVSLYTTGGGSGENTYNDPTYDLTMSIINKKSIYGLHNKFDGDSVTIIENNTEIENTENRDIEELEDVEEILLTVEDETVAEGTKNNWQHYKPSSLKMPLNENLRNVISGGKSEHIRTPSSKRKCPSLDDDNGWSTRRRPTTGMNITLARKFEELTEIKAEAAKFQLAILKEENLHQNTKWEWQREEYALKQDQLKELHELQKMSLQLDIEIKKKQLEKLNMLM